MTPTRKPQNRRPTERHKQAFETWYANGCDFRKTGDKLSIHHSNLYLWADRYGWREEADRRDIKAQEKLAAAAVDRHVKMIENQRKAGELLYVKGIQALQGDKVKCESVGDAARLIKEGFALARQAEGLPDWVVEVLNGSDSDLRAQQDDDRRTREAAERLLDERERAQSRGG